MTNEKEKSEFTPYSDGFCLGQHDQLNGCVVKDIYALAKTLGYKNFEHILDFVGGYEYGIVCGKAIESSFPEGEE